MLNVVGNKKIYFTVSIILVVAAFTAIVSFGFWQGIDFSGGTLWQFKVSENTPSTKDIESFFESALQIKDARVNYDILGESFLVRFGVVGEAEHQEFLEKIKTEHPS